MSDAKMLEQHGDDWPDVFAGWAQQLLTDFDNSVDIVDVIVDVDFNIDLDVDVNII